MVRRRCELWQALAASVPSLDLPVSHKDDRVVDCCLPRYLFPSCSFSCSSPSSPLSSSSSSASKGQSSSHFLRRGVSPHAEEDALLRAQHTANVVTHPSVETRQEALRNGLSPGGSPGFGNVLGLRHRTHGAERVQIVVVVVVVVDNVEERLAEKVHCERKPKQHEDGSDCPIARVPIEWGGRGVCQSRVLLPGFCLLNFLFSRTPTQDEHYRAPKVSTHSDSVQERSLL